MEAPATLGCALVLLPWTALLFVTLPHHYEANHWAIAWGGFDIGLGVADRHCDHGRQTVAVR
jgi:hypothetical protein